jgi:hypothetical protein
MDKILFASHKSISVKNIYENMTSGVLIQPMFRKKDCFKVYTGNKLNHKIYLRKTLEKMFLENPPKAIYCWDGTPFPFNRGHALYYQNGYNNQNKLKDRERLYHAGLNIPRTIGINVSQGNIKEDELIIQRPLQHSKGDNFFVLDINQYMRNKHELYNHPSYFTIFINKERELRIHCGGKKVFSVLEKTRPSEDAIKWNRNVDGSDGFNYINWNNFDPIITSAIMQSVEALKALSLSHGAVDVLIHNGSAYILEVNKAVGLDNNGYMAKKYAAFIDLSFVVNTNDLFSGDYKKAKSFVWKREQLNLKNYINA